MAPCCSPGLHYHGHPKRLSASSPALEFPIINLQHRLTAALRSLHCQSSFATDSLGRGVGRMDRNKNKSHTLKEPSIARLAGCKNCREHPLREQAPPICGNTYWIARQKCTLHAITDNSPGSRTDEQSGDDVNEDIRDDRDQGQDDGGVGIASGIGVYASRALSVGESLPPEGLIVLMSCAVGLMTGFGVVLFNVGVHKLHDIVWQGFPSNGASWLPPQQVERHWVQVVCVPAGGGLIVGILNFFRESWGQVEAETLAGNSRSSQAKKRVVICSKVKAFLQPVIKTVAAVVTLATGNSLGPEGPSVEVGAAIANGLGTALKNSRERKLSLVAAGSAAGISSGFNAAISGCFFAVESVLRPSSADSAPSLTTAMVILSSVLASVISQAGLGSDPAFKIPAYDFRSPAELPLYLVLGILCGLVSVALTNCSSYSFSVFSKIRSATGIPAALLPPFGGLCVGVIAVTYPEVLYWGFENVDILLESRPLQKGPPAILLLQLVGAKIVATSICRGSGLVGGVYAPSLFIGAALGSAYGKLMGYAVHHADPVYHLDALQVAAPQAYALVGMAAMLAGVCQVPLTSVLLLFELTRDYRIIIPLMAAVGLSSWVASSAKKQQERKMFYKNIECSNLEISLKFKESNEQQSPDIDMPTSSSQRKRPFKHNHLDEDRCALDNSLCVANEDFLEEELLTEIMVAAAMRTSFTAVAAHTRVLEVVELMLVHKEWCVLLVRDGNLLEGIVTLSDIQQAAKRINYDGLPKVDTLPVAALCSSWATDGSGLPLITAYPDMNLRVAQRLMAGRGLRQLPVISRDMYKKDKIKVVLGILDRDSIQLACRVEATRRHLCMSPSSYTWQGDGRHGDNNYLAD